MSEPTADLSQLLSELTTGAARRLAEQDDAEGDRLKRRARALFAYADALGEPEATVESEPNEAADEPALPPPGTPKAPPSNKRPLLRALVEERPSPGWSPRELHTTLVDRELIAPETSMPAIRVTLRRMVERGELELDPYSKLYTLPGRGGEQERFIH
jgi:hypothetical protein